MTQKQWSLAALLTVLFFSTAHDASLLLHSPVAVGADGYYYVLQIHELLNHDHLYFPTNTPLVFYALAALGALIGNIILAIKLGSILLHLLLCLGIYALVSAITRNRWLGVLGGAMAALSAMHFYMIAEFIKNSGALTLLIWGGWSAVRASQSPQTRWAVLSIALFIAAIFSHISIWAIILSLLALVLLLRWLMIAERSKYHKLLASFVVLLLAISPAFIAIQRRIELPVWLKRELLAQANWPISLTSPVGKAEMVALLLVAPVTLFLIIRHRQVLPAYYFSSMIGAIALWSLLITLNPFLNHDVNQFGIVGRLNHLMYIQVAILVPGLIWLILQLYPKATTAIVTLTMIFVATSMISLLPTGLQPRYLLNRVQLIQALPEQQQQFGTNPLVIAQHGDEFVVTWVLNMPARQKLPEDTKNQSVYWLLHGVECQSLTPSMIAMAEEENNLCLTLTNHNDLSQWLSILTVREQNRLLARNPHLKRYLKPSV